MNAKKMFNFINIKIKEETKFDDNFCENIIFIFIKKF